jgi:GNAT superfamily N-acetyltransferase
VNVSVRHALRDDASTLLHLIEALADFEKLAPPDAAARERLLRDGWPEGGAHPRFTAWIAEVEEEGRGVKRPAGYAITFETYSSFLALPTFYIEDIFVLPAFRRDGVGSALMQRLMQAAKESGCGRMEWVVLDWNTGAQQFYRRFGAQHLTDWQYYRLRLDRE